GELVDEALWDDQRGGDDGGGVVDEVGFDVELAEAAGLACFELVGSLTGTPGVEPWLLAVQLLLLELRGAGVPVADLGVQPFLDGASGAFDPGPGDVRDLGVVGCGKVRCRPAATGLVHAAVGPGEIEAIEQRADAV